MAYCAQVKYYYINKHRKSSEENIRACYSGVSGPEMRSQDQIATTLDIDETLTQEEVDSFLRLAESLLDTEMYSVVVNFPGRELKAFISLSGLNYNRTLILLYLTVFRYVQEFPEIIKNTCGVKYKTAQLKYEKFASQHLNSVTKKYNGLYGHGLIVPKDHVFGPNAGAEIIALKDVRARILQSDKTFNSVQRYFRP